MSSTSHGLPQGNPASVATDLSDLPPPNTTRWVVRRKAAVVAAVAQGRLTLEQACERYMLSQEEFVAWQSALESHGLRGLRTTRIQEYRARPQPQGADAGDAGNRALAAVPAGGSDW
jgi:uncharacterized protein DUF1153